MKRIITLFVVAVIASIICNAQEVKSSENWSGRLTVGIIKLNIGFVIYTQTNGKQICTMNVPEQGAKDIPVKLQKNDSDSLNLSISALRATYKGRKVSSSSIDGVFTQNGISLPLNLKPGGFELKRPQTPTEPFAYTTQEVVL